MRNTAEASTETQADTAPRNWERNETRQAILDAARRLAMRGGTETITLSAVAAEAGFAPPAVYAYFVSKDDLYLAVVADDLYKLARTMRGDEDTEASECEGAASDETADADDAMAELSADGFNEGGSNAGDVVALHGTETPETGTDVAESVTDESPVAAGVNEGTEEDAPSDPEDDETVDFSLAEIEQAIGAVLASPDADYVADAAILNEDVPDAFPEELIDDEDDEGTEKVAPEPSTVANLEEHANRSRGPRLRAPWRRPRDEAQKIEPAQQMLQAGEGDAAVPAAPKTTEEMASAIAGLQQAMAKVQSQPTDAWLERRLRVFERTLADIETRMEKAERDSMTALSTVSEGFKALDQRLSDTLSAAEQRGNDGEQRQKAMAADLHMYVKDLSGRLSLLEKSMSRMHSGDMAANLASMQTADFEDAVPAEPESQQVGDLHLENDEQDQSVQSESADAAPKGDNYLSAARRAAMSAAAQADSERGLGALAALKIPAVATSLSPRTLRIVAGGLALVLTLIVANIVLRSHASSPAAAAEQVTKTIALSPDERVVALAKAGNSKAELVAALKLLNGDGVSADVPSAAAWLERSAKQNEPVAEYWLGTLYERGHGVSKDLATAMGWYEKAAEAGNVKAMYRLGVAAASGWDGQVNYVEAGKWFSKAASLGALDAQYNLAVLYERGQGVPQNLQNAFKWYAIAAAQGDADSKARIDTLASQITSTQVAAAQAEAGKFKSAEPDPKANLAPTVMEVAQLHAASRLPRVQ